MTPSDARDAAKILKRMEDDLRLFEPVYYRPLVSIDYGVPEYGPPVDKTASLTEDIRRLRCLLAKGS